MQTTVRSTPDGLIIRVEADRLDAAAALEFKEAIRRAIAEAGNPVILDLSRVTFLDSSGLGALVAVLKMLEPARHLELAGVTGPVAKVLKLTRMDTVFSLRTEAPPCTVTP